MLSTGTGTDEFRRNVVLLLRQGSTTRRHCSPAAVFSSSAFDVIIVSVEAEEEVSPVSSGLEADGLEAETR